jgi:hypothetical protein
MRREQSMMTLVICVILLSLTTVVRGFTAATGVSRTTLTTPTPTALIRQPSASVSTVSTLLELRMVDNNVIMGVGIGLAGMVAGIGLVAFTEQQGERAKERGSGLSDTMSTRITGQLMEDVEISSVDDLDSLTSQLENALKKAGGINDANAAQVLEMSEEEKKKKIEAADDGW